METSAENRSISGLQLFAVSAASALLGLAIYPIDALGVSIRGRFSAIPLAFFPLISGMFLFLTAFERSGANSFFDMLQKLFGKVFGKALLLFLSLYFLFRASLAISRQTSMIKLYLLEETPIEVIMLFILFSAAFAVSTGLRRLSYTSVIVLLIISLPLAFVLISMMFKMNYGELRILVGADFSTVKKEIPGALLSLSGCECGLLFIGKTRSKKADRALLYGSLATASIALILCALSVGMLSVNAADAVQFPFVEAAKLINFAGASLSERIDLIPITVLILCLMLQVGSMLYCSAATLASALDLDSPNTCIYLLPPLALLLSYYLGGLDFLSIVSVVGLLLILVLSVVCAGVSNTKRNGGELG